MKRGKEESKFRNLVLIFLFVFIIILIFTLIDVFVHSLSKEYAVPDYYFRNKIIFGTIIGFFAYLLVRKKNVLIKSLFFSSVVSILLQTRYFLEGYPIKFVIEFLFFHFLMLSFTSSIFFKVFDKFLKGGRFF